jgi:hypothetical protein
VTVALGAGALVGVWSLPDRQVRAAACIPIAMGLVLFLYSWFLPREGDAPR